jgi:uncharacterized protein YndB with AHSA1/START domain
MSILAEAPAHTTLAPTAELTRTIHALRSRVFEAWTNPEMVRQWFGPATMRCSTVELDAHTGGAYSLGVVSLTDPKRPEAMASGNYTKVVPNKVLQFTWKPTWNPGEESLVTVSFEDAAQGTQVTVLHQNCDADASVRYTEGWTGCLDKLEVVLAD